MILMTFEIIKLKAEEKLQLSSKNNDTKTVFLRMPFAPSQRLRVKIVDGSEKEKIVWLMPNAPFIGVIIKQPSNNKITIFIYPESLYLYNQIQKKSRAAYNYNAESPHSPGEERLLQALTTTVEYDFDTMPETIILPDPLTMLNNLVEFNK